MESIHAQVFNHIQNAETNKMIRVHADEKYVALFLNDVEIDFKLEELKVLLAGL